MFGDEDLAADEERMSFKPLCVRCKHWHTPSELCETGMAHDVPAQTVNGVRLKYDTELNQIVIVPNEDGNA